MNTLEILFCRNSTLNIKCTIILPLFFIRLFVFKIIQNFYVCSYFFLVLCWFINVKTNNFCTKSIFYYNTLNIYVIYKLCIIYKSPFFKIFDDLKNFFHKSDPILHMYIVKITCWFEFELVEANGITQYLFFILYTLYTLYFQNELIKY